MRAVKEMFPCAMKAALTLLLAASPLAAQPAAQPADLELICRPEHGLLDQRQQRPRDVKGHSPFSTFYLFDNPQLFELRVSLMNLSPDRLRIADVAGDWARALKVQVQRDGVALGAGEIRVETARRLRRALVYLRDGKPIEEPRFRRQPTSPGAEPLMSYNDSRREEQAVDELPRVLATYEEAVVILSLRAADGGDLPLGLYTVKVSDEANHVRCPGEELVVMRAPRSPLDTVDAHIVRANAYQVAGDLDSAADELARATDQAPDVLKGWVYRSALALKRNDLAGQAEAATRLEKLVTEKAGASQEDFEVILKDAKALARQAPELRRLADERAKQKPKQ